ncbi:DNA-binding protein [Streptomyces sp. NPDC047014]|uniref:DNA-binding protein n=1 Tax=Streptomyces sp. NPDC047014 TaxID=3155736 RepID=UPI0033C497ED
MTGATAELLLKAGAVLPSGTPGAGAAAVDLTARTYRHPGLGDERVVIRLAPAELGAAEDLAAGFLGLVRDEEEPPVVGLSRRQALGFPEWVLVHHPEDGHHALAVVPELDRIAQQAKTKPKAALDACLELAGRLAASVPHFLPLFHEQAARLFLAVENTTYASQLFGRARTAEAQNGLPVDEDRLDGVFLEFALAGALPVKVLSGYGKALAARVSPAEAYERFRRLCVRRTAGGLPPSAQAATELRRLARAAGLTGTEPEQDYLAELLPLPATLRAAHGWWKAHRTALVALARRVPAVRGTLLGLTPPSGGDGELSDLWLDILEESGATAGLADGSLPEEERCADGTAGWLERFHSARHSGWGRRKPLPLLVTLVERSAPQLRAELAAPGRETGLRIGLEDVDLLDLLLALDVPVADPDRPGGNSRHGALNLSEWASGEHRRDLLALGADPRFHPAFDRALDNFGEGSAEDVRRIAAAPGGRPLLTAWMQRVAGASTAVGLPRIPNAIRRLTWLPAEALELAREEVAAAAAADLAASLTRTLRTGLFEELAWPAWEEAVAELAPRQDRQDLTVVEAWPYLIVANNSQVRVLDADSTVLTHDLRVPSGTGHHRLGFHYVDGELLVFWSSWQDNETRGYWHTAPGTVVSLGSERRYWSMRGDYLSLPLAGGGRTTGAGVLHRGDTQLPDERAVISDGISHWVWQSRDRETGQESGWREYDPVGAAYGRLSQPAFFADAPHGQAAFAHQSGSANWLRPTPTVPGSVLGAPVDGLLGWRIERTPGQGWRGTDTAGRTVTLPGGGHAPLAALAFPGDDRPRTLTQDWRELRISDPEGVLTTKSGGDHRGHQNTFRTGIVDHPPLAYWYALRPRDLDGSVALRALDRDTVAKLLEAAAAAAKATDLPELVGAALPQITSPELVHGICEVVRFTLTQQQALDRVADRLAGGAAPAEARVQGPHDRLFADAVSGLMGSAALRWGGDHDGAHHTLSLLGAALAGTDHAQVPGLLHFDTPELPHYSFWWTQLLDEPAALAYRAAAVPATDEERAVLLGLLRRIDGLGLASAQGSAGTWRRVLLHLGQAHLTGPDGQDRNVYHRSLLPLGGGAVLALTEHGESLPDGHEFGALFHDPTGGFTAPGPYTVRGTAPLGDRTRDAAWLTAFLDAAAAHGPAPFHPEAAEEFARLTGVSGTLARLVVAGLPNVDSGERNFLSPEVRTALGVKAAEAAHARTELGAVEGPVRRAVVGALLPADPAKLWSEGPDAAAAAQVWNQRVGRRTPVPEWLGTEAARAVRGGRPAHRVLAAILDPAAATELSVDVPWTVSGDHVVPAEPATDPFDAQVLTSTVAMAGWLAHRLPAGHPVRAALPPALTAVRQRLASPELLLEIAYYTSLPDFRKAAGTPTETGEGYERYGAVVMATYDDRPKPAVRTALLDSTGSDPHLPALRGEDQRPSGIETALRTAQDPRFAELLADPGAPAAGTADAEGTWWPQDASRSVPDLVAEVAAEYGLGADAATLYLVLLAMPDPSDRNTARWTGWKPARLKAARAELAATELVVTADRSRAGRSLFLPGGWADMPSPTLPVEQWKLPLYGLTAGGRPPLGVLAPAEPVAALYRRAWQRVREGDVPRFEELKVKRARGRRR